MKRRLLRKGFDRFCLKKTIKDDDFLQVKKKFLNTFGNPFI